MTDCRDEKTSNLPMNIVHAALCIPREAYAEHLLHLCTPQLGHVRNRDSSIHQSLLDLKPIDTREVITRAKRLRGRYKRGVKWDAVGAVHGQMEV